MKSRRQVCLDWIITWSIVPTLVKYRNSTLLPSIEQKWKSWKQETILRVVCDRLSSHKYTKSHLNFCFTFCFQDSLQRLKVNTLNWPSFVVIPCVHKDVISKLKEISFKVIMPHGSSQTNNWIKSVINTKKYHVFAPMGRFQLEVIYLYFPPSSHLVYLCFCPVGLSLL